MRHYCRKCNGFFSGRVDLCPNCGEGSPLALTPLDELYHAQALTCFTCKYSVKRKTAYVSLVGAQMVKQWATHYRLGQIFCWRRAPDGQKGMWVSKKTGNCNLGYMPAKFQQGGLRGVTDELKKEE